MSFKKRVLSWIGIGMAVIFLASCSNSNTTTIGKVSDETVYTQIKNSVSDVYEQVSKGCVGIAVSNNSVSASGSGVIYKKQDDTYYVVTNAHVVEDMTTCRIYFGGTKYNNAKIVGYDTTNDIGVVTFELDLFNQKLEKELVVHDFFNYEDTDMLTIGQTVLAIGCPLGLDNYNILTTGVVSSISDTQISTDAAINPGNSGGGLFNLAGRLVGINTEKEVWSYGDQKSNYNNTITTDDVPVEGRGFAIALDTVKRCVKEIETKGGKIEHNLKLGITVEVFNYGLNPDNFEQNQSHFPVTDSAVYFMVTEVEQGSYALKAGIKQYDVLLKVNDKDIEYLTDISDELKFISKGDSLKLTISRKNQDQTDQAVEITVSF